jgi:hypothetical protein
VAKLPALIAKLAPFDGRSPETLIHVGRRVREAGFIATTKRGGGAAEMTVTHAANLLIGFNGTDVPKDAPMAVEYFRPLAHFFTKQPLQSYAQTIHAAVNAPTFGKALERLIDAVPDLIEHLKDKVRQEDDLATAEYADEYKAANPNWPKDFLIALRNEDVGLEVKFWKKMVFIELYDEDERGSRRAEISAAFADFPKRPIYFKQAWSDRRIAVSFGLPTLMAAWFALHPGKQIGSISEESLEWMRGLP